LISSHNLYEIENLCDRVIILDGGKVLKTGEIYTVDGKSDRQYKITLSSPSDKVLSALEKLSGVRLCKNVKEVYTVVADNSCSAESISRAITSNGGVIVGFTSSESSLEELYLKLISKRHWQ
jgi:ABC-2 type transport system ATP-binding protein